MKLKKLLAGALVSVLCLTGLPVGTIKASDQSAKAVAISLGNEHTGVLDSDGRFWAWGKNNGELGNGKAVGDYLDLDFYGEPKPVPAKTNTTFKELRASRRRTYLIGKDGGLYRTGIQGQDDKSYKIPTRIMGNTTWQKVSGTTVTWGAIDTDGNLFMWGENGHGELGNGQVDKKAYVKEEDAIQVMPGTKFKEVVVGNSHVGAIDTNGHLYMWGDGYGGRLGNGSTENSAVPIQIMGETTFQKVCAGHDTSGAIDTDGNLYMWGYNSAGEVGIGMPEDSSQAYVSTPQQVMPGTKFKDLALYQQHAAAIDTDGYLYTWGDNSCGQLGNGERTSNPNPLPIKIKPDTRFVAVDVGEYTTGAIDSEGNVWMCGSSRYGQIGNGKYQPGDDYSSDNVALLETSLVRISLGSSGGNQPEQGSKSIEIGGKAVLKADKKITKWTSSDKTIAAVKKKNKKSAVLSGKKEGTVTIKAYTGKGKKQKVYMVWNITVTEPMP